MGQTKNWKKTKNRKRIKKGKRNFSRKNVKMNGGFKISEIIKLFLSILIFGIFFYIQCYALNITYHLQMSVPNMRELHIWFLLIKNFCTFLDKLYPKNEFTLRLYGCIKYVVQQIPNETARHAIENAIPAIILRPNIVKGMHYIIKNKIEKSEMRDSFIVLSKGAEQFSEYLRIFNLDLGALKSMDELHGKYNFNATDYTTLFHVAINYEGKFNEIIAYINKLLFKVYNADKNKIEEIFFNKNLKPVQIFMDAHDVLQSDELSDELSDGWQEIINNGIITVFNNIAIKSQDYNNLELLVTKPV